MKLLPNIYRAFPTHNAGLESALLVVNEQRGARGNIRLNLDEERRGTVCIGYQISQCLYFLRRGQILGRGVHVERGEELSLASWPNLGTPWQGDVEPFGPGEPLTHELMRLPVLFGVLYQIVIGVQSVQKPQSKCI